MWNSLRKLRKDESGATAIEYGLIAGFVAIAIVAALTALGGSLNTVYNNVANTLTGAGGG